MTDIAAMPALTLNHFAKTQQGQQLIQEQHVFIIAGRMYQGYKGVVIEVQPWQPTKTEMEHIIDVDGTRLRIDKMLGDRRESRHYLKEEELEKRRQIKRRALRDDLELRKLAEEQGEKIPADILAKTPAGIDPAEFAAMQGLLANVQAQLDALKKDKAEPAPEPPPMTVEGATDISMVAYSCPDCGLMPATDHAKPKFWLRGHKSHCKVRRERQAKAS